MPLSDDALEQLALLAVTEDASIRAKTARHYIPDLIAELRAARKVVGAARAFMDAGPSIAYYDAGLGLPFGDGPEWEDDLKNALDEYDAASAEPQEQRT